MPISWFNAPLQVFKHSAKSGNLSCYSLSKIRLTFLIHLKGTFSHVTEFYKRFLLLLWISNRLVSSASICPYLPPAQNSILTFPDPKVKHFLHQRYYATVLGVEYNISRYYFLWMDFSSSFFYFIFGTFHQHEIAAVFQ